ncbi:tyrosine-type recombinase/integrase [Streptomyces sp. NPDC094038]|uniref:tyrosine-type recombinase/integrase n=1 Tax=Streptomyces sp. NPDC094038 TaxID=3366055 RepID=UPI00381036A9
MTIALVENRPAELDDVTDALMGAVTAEFRQLMSWDMEGRQLVFPRDHPLLGGPECLVSGCDKVVFHTADHGLCVGCAKRLKASGQSFEEFVATVKRHWRSIGISTCGVPECGRPSKTSRAGLCSAHLGQQKSLGLPVEKFVHHPRVKPLPGFGPCEVAACPRSRDGHSRRYCMAHYQRRLLEISKGSTLDEETWRLTTPAIAQAGVISLLGLPDQVVAEILYGLQQRVAAGIRHKDHHVRPFCDLVRTRQVGSLTELDTCDLGKMNAALAKGFLKHVVRLTMSPETERHKDTWDGAAFGMTGYLHFEKISQPWLRRAAQDWAVDDAPRHRGSNPRGAMQTQINCIVRLSESLRLNRPDQGTDPRLLGRDDIVAFLNRMRYLVQKGEVAATRHVVDVRHLRRMLLRMRSLGLAQPGRPLHGLSEQFTFRPEDIPDDPEDTGAGRDLPPEVMRQLCDHLDALGHDDPQARTAVELLMDTGRRPDEICKLPFDCLERDGDGEPVLIYDNRKAFRNGRRLPIAKATAALITEQQQRVRARFPRTPDKDLALLPSPVANPHGAKSLTASWLGDRHRGWADSLPDFLLPTVVAVAGERVTKMLPFDKAKIFAYAYRHTYAQRHADAGVPVDALRALMDHRQLATTQRYYRVGEKRQREAVERVTAMQFDRHGNRVWRHAKAVLDSEHARRAIGETQVPYGTCTEPSNVAAGGQDCPVRFRCVGCSHFRTDVSYLPDLEAYLADLLRNRERLAAFTEADDWAKSEATPSDDEIRRVRRLVKCVREELDDLTDEDRAQIQQAVTVVRRTRAGVVPLGMPKVRQPLPDLRPERTV